MKNSSGTAAAVVRRAARVKYGRAALFRAVYLFLLFFFLSPLLPPAPDLRGSVAFFAPEALQIANINNAAAPPPSRGENG